MVGRRSLGRVALALLGTLAALLTAEILLRSIGVAPSRYAQPRHLEAADKRTGLDTYPDDPRDYFPLDLRDGATRQHWSERLPDLEQRSMHTPHAVPLRYSRELCRGAAIGPVHHPRVVVIGDSFTEGQGVREDDTFVARLRTRLPNVELLNCGRRGYDFPELHEWFTQHLALEPDVVVYAMLLNDPQQSPAFHAGQRYLNDWILDRRSTVSAGDGSPPAWPPRLYAMLHDRYEARRVENETTRWYLDMVREPNRAGWAATLAHLEAMRDAMRRRGGRFVVVLWPLLVDLRAYPFSATHRTIVGALRQRHIEVHDTLPAFRGHDASTLWVHPADHHPNERAHAIFARAIASIVRAAVEGP